MNVVCYLPRFRRAAREIKVLEARESWSRGEIEQFQLERLNRVWAHARLHVPYYAEMARNLPDRFGTIEEFSTLFPVLKKSQVRDCKKQLISSNPLPGLWKYTSGTTGQPSSVYWSRAAHREAQCAKY